MNYQTHQPHADLSALVKFYWTLEVPFNPSNLKQKIIPDGCIEMTFNLKDKIKRYTTENNYILQADSMVMGQRTKSFLIEPIGVVDTFAICFYPYGFANFVSTPLKDIVDSEISIASLFGTAIAQDIEQKIKSAANTLMRIEIIEKFLRDRLNTKSLKENLVKTTVETLLATKGNQSINKISKQDPSKRRQLERKFKAQIGISPKQLSKVIRLQAALHLMLNKKGNLTSIAYESNYFDQAHFIKDFKEFVGITPKDFLTNGNMALANLFYK